MTTRMRACATIIVTALILASSGVSSAQLLGNLLGGTVGGSVGGTVDGSVGGSINGPVGGSVSGSVSGSVEGSVRGSVGDLFGDLFGPLAPPVTGSGPFVLSFETTSNLYGTPNGTQPAANPDYASATMTISVRQGKTDLQFITQGVRPNTIYTVWTVFYPLAWPIYFPPGSIRPALDPNFPQGPPGYYVEGGVVAPTASLSAQFTNGMKMDPGVTFVTDGYGNGYIHLTLDYNILGNTYDDAPPVGNKVIVTQCVVDTPGPQSGPCPSPSNVQRVTTTWLRMYIAQVPPSARAAYCANYDGSDSTSTYWQCIDPSTVDQRTGNGLPRVWRFPFDHFRLAAHPDGLTHGFIGGNEDEHVIDMVGRRCHLTNNCP